MDLLWDGFASLKGDMSMIRFTVSVLAAALVATMLAACSDQTADQGSLAVSGEKTMSPSSSGYVPDECQSAARTDGAVIVICPAGDGTTLAEAGAAITVTMVDETGGSVGGYPADGFYVRTPSGYSSCGFETWLPFPAVGPTASLGTTTIEGAFPGMRGGFFDTIVLGFDKEGVIHRFHCDRPGQFCCDEPPLQLPIAGRSVDLDANGSVNLVDYQIFTSHFGAGAPYDASCDFNNDGTVNLVDFTLFSPHFGHTCN